MALLPAAIGIVLSSDQLEVLLVRRRDIPIWVLPGGGIEINENSEDALKREVFEETGYHIQILRKCAEYSPANSLTSYTTVFVCQISAGEQCLSTETSAIAFYPLTTLPSSFFPPHRQWLKEGLASDHLIRRALSEISYFALLKYLFRSPFQVLRYAWTRFMKN